MDFKISSHKCDKLINAMARVVASVFLKIYILLLVAPNDQSLIITGSVLSGKSWKKMIACDAFFSVFVLFYFILFYYFFNVLRHRR